MNIAHTIPLADTWTHGGWGWGGMALMMVAMLLFWAAVFVGVVWLICGAGGGSWRREPNVLGETPVEILDRRFAEGAIEEDYGARREVWAGRDRAVGTA